MLLPSPKPCFCSAEQKCFQTNATKGTLLLILVLNLFLCENVASLPVNVRGTGHDQVYLQDLFNHAIKLSYNISKLNREMRKMFFISDFSSKKFFKFVLELHKDEETMPKMIDSCHTPPINTPKTIEESRKLSLEDFLIIILNLTGTWKEPLHYQVTKLNGTLGANEAILSTAKNIEAQSKELRELIKWILNMVHPGIEPKDYAEWSDLKSLQAADEETYLSALFKLSFCLGIDTHMVDLNLNYLICVFIGGDSCSSSSIMWPSGCFNGLYRRRTIYWRYDWFETAKVCQDSSEMPPSFFHPCSWAILLLLVSNFLLWENVTSVPLSTNETDYDNLYLEELFDHAMILLHNISKLNTEMRRTYIESNFSEKFHHKFLVSSSKSYDQFMLEYFEDQEFLIKTLSCCHNYSIKTPKNMDEIQKILVEDFPKLILSRVQAWNGTLHNLLTILESTPGTHDAVLSIARNIRTKNADLFEDSKKILNKIYGKIETVDHAVLMGLEDFQSSDEDFRLFALCKLFYCLRKDMNMVNIYIQLLSCVMLVKSDVCLSQRIRDNS